MIRIGRPPWRISRLMTPHRATHPILRAPCWTIPANWAIQPMLSRTSPRPYGSGRPVGWRSRNTWRNCPTPAAVLFDRYLSNRAGCARRPLRYTAPEELLVGLEAAAPDPTTGTVRPTHAGMLLFGYDPQLHIPQSKVVCIRYADSLGVGRYLDCKNFTGTLPELIDQTAEFLTRHMNVGAQIQGFKRVDPPEYPIEALREAVVNALVHRDYSRIGETVRVFFYADRIEVRSPGLLLPGITVADLQEMRVPSRPRNPLLAGFLRDIPGYMERVGSGIRLMVQEMRGLALPDPEFREQHEFVMILRGPSAPTEAGPEALNPRQLQALQVVQAQGSINSQEYCAATGASDRTALRDLRDLVDRGILVSRGAKRYTRYYLP
jgi:predicted HTH transcriptional regulator